jgi:hypothetical protein
MLTSAMVSSAMTIFVMSLLSPPGARAQRSPQLTVSEVFAVEDAAGRPHGWLAASSTAGNLSLWGEREGGHHAEAVIVVDREGSTLELWGPDGPGGSGIVLRTGADLHPTIAILDESGIPVWSAP